MISSHYAGALGLLVLLLVAALLALSVLLRRNARLQQEILAERERSATLQHRQEEQLARCLAEQAGSLAGENRLLASADEARHKLLRIETVGRLTGGIAHDFNNVLMIISGNLQLLQVQLEPDHALRRYIDKAAEAAAKGVRLTGRLLAFSRIQQIEIVEAELDPIVRRALMAMDHSGAPQVQIEYQLNAGKASVATDAAQLEQVIMNLSINAIEAMPEGGVLSIATEYLPSGFSDLPAVSGSHGAIAIRVSDTGVGMDAEVCSKAVEPFFTTKQHDKGAGLGLAQAYGVVRLCGGNLRLHSSPGRGTTVEICLPCNGNMAHQLVVQSSPQAGVPAVMMDPSVRPVLIIDDDSGVRGIFVEALVRMGHRVIQAADGLAGLAALSKMKPSLAIIDFMMPGMNGDEVARLARHTHPDLAIIFISGYSDTQALSSIPNTTLLRKPVSIERLSAAVAAATKN